MAPSFKTVISYFREKLVSVLGMSSTATNTFAFEIPGDPISVSHFSDLLKAKYTIAGALRMNSVAVTELNVMKENSSSNHEYIAARVAYPDGCSFFVAIERGRGPPSQDISAGAGIAAGSSPSLPSTPVSTVESLDSLLSQSAARDIISSLPSSGKRHPNDIISHTLYFGHPSAAQPSPTVSSLQLPYYHLVVLANAVHLTSRQYCLGTSNCYVYAAFITKVLEDLYLPATNAQPTKIKGLFRSILNKRLIRGKWHGLTICHLGSIDTAPVVQRFQQDLEEFRVQVKVSPFWLMIYVLSILMLRSKTGSMSSKQKT